MPVCSCVTGSSWASEIRLSLPEMLSWLECSSASAGDRDLLDTGGISKYSDVSAG